MEGEARGVARKDVSGKGRGREEKGRVEQGQERGVGGRGGLKSGRKPRILVLSLIIAFLLPKAMQLTLLL